jgi:hypothetical protein
VNLGDDKMQKWFTVAVLFAFLVLPRAAFCQIASVDLGLTDDEQGIITCNANASDGDFESAVSGPADGSDDRECKRSCANDLICDPDDQFRNQHLYFDVLDVAIEASPELMVSVVVFDAPEMAGTDLTLTYNSSEDLGSPSSEFFPFVVGNTGVPCNAEFGIPAGHPLRRTLEGSDAWVTVSWEIANAAFSNLAHGCDFRIQIGEDNCEETRRKLCFDRVVVQTSDVGAGACCTAGNCDLKTEADCLAGGGAYAGDDSLCAPDSCPDGGGPVFRRGDHDGSGAVDITDALNLLSFLFLGLFNPICQDASDYDNSGALDISDGLNSLGFLFLGGNTPPPPGVNDCGPDPQEVLPPGGGLPEQPNIQLGCDEYPSATGVACP